MIVGLYTNNTRLRLSLRLEQVRRTLGDFKVLKVFRYMGWEVREGLK